MLAVKGLRAWTRWIHLAVGLALPVLLLLHIWPWEEDKTNGSPSKTSRFSGEIDIA